MMTSPFATRCEGSLSRSTTPSRCSRPPGVELYEHLIETGHEIPTILVTGYPNDGVRQRMLTLGVECYLPKPLEEAVLIECLRSAVSRGKAPQV